jgi:hypothetical protein
VNIIRKEAVVTLGNEALVSTLDAKGVLDMTIQETQMIEKLAEESELVLENDYDKRDLKERRGVNKNMLYDGSKKLKHSVPKGTKI